MRDNPDEKCEDCGGTLPAGEGCAWVECTCCEQSFPHPCPLPSGTEILYPGPMGRRYLETVVASNGPDAITVLPVNEDATHPFRLHDLTPVITYDATLPRGGGRSGLSALGSPRWVADFSGDQVVWKHARPSFQPSFFDKPCPAQDVRIHWQPETRVRRTKLQA